MSCRCCYLALRHCVMFACVKVDWNFGDFVVTGQERQRLPPDSSSHDGWFLSVAQQVTIEYYRSRADTSQSRGHRSTCYSARTDVRLPSGKLQQCISRCAIRGRLHARCSCLKFELQLQYQSAPKLGATDGGRTSQHTNVDATAAMLHSRAGTDVTVFHRSLPRQVLDARLRIFSTVSMSAARDDVLYMPELASRVSAVELAADCSSWQLRPGHRRHLSAVGPAGRTGSELLSSDGASSTDCCRQWLKLPSLLLEPDRGDRSYGSEYGHEVILVGLF